MVQQSSHNKQQKPLVAKDWKINRKCEHKEKQLLIPGAFPFTLGSYNGKIFSSKKKQTSKFLKALIVNWLVLCLIFQKAKVCFKNLPPAKK